MAELVSVLGDPNTHSAGGLLANPATKVYAGGLLVIGVGSPAEVDGLLHVGAGDGASSGSNKVSVEGVALHRNGDARACGATTRVIGQTKVFSS